MKVLVLSHDPFVPTDSGQRQRTARLVEALRERAEVAVLVPDPVAGACPPRRHERLRMLSALLRGRSLWVARFDDPRIRDAIARALADGPDLVVCAGLPSAFLLPDDADVPVWIDEQNVEWRILERALPHLPALRRWVVGKEIPRLRKAESDAVSRAALVTACSQEDASLLGRAKVLRNVCGEPSPDFLRRPLEGTILFTGTLEWEPNVDAACWMAEKVLPLVRAGFPTATFRIVGRKPSPRVLALAGLPGVEVVGSVPSVWPELGSAAIAVAPIRMGSGTRIKILEAASASVPVVSTSMGAEGLEMRDGVEVALADTDSRFAERCLELLRDPGKAAAMGAAARRWRVRTHGREAFGQDVADLLGMFSKGR